MRNFCVIGSGISGATIANLLSKKHSVDLYDKARGLGGRSSFKRLDEKRGFDHGAQYFSPKTSEFKSSKTSLGIYLFPYKELLTNLFITAGCSIFLRILL